jgi:hypothetical protein
MSTFVFRHVRKIAKKKPHAASRLFVRPPVRMEQQLGYRWENFHEINIWRVMKDMSREFMFQQNLTRNEYFIQGPMRIYDTVSMYPSQKEKCF